VTVPWWLVLTRLLTRARVVTHVHEAEDAVPRPIRVALAAPLLLAHKIVANSEISRDIVVGAVPRLSTRTTVIYNGVPGPAEPPHPPREELTPPLRLGLVGRLSPRKGTDVAVEALALLRDRGLHVTLDLVGGVFPGYEWFETDVRRAVEAHRLTDDVRWRGVLPDVWGALAQVDIALVPSRVEPFGNAAVEAMLAGRPVIAGDTQGLREIVRPGDNGRLCRPGDATSLADEVMTAVADWSTTLERAEAALTEARERYSPEQYRQAIARAIEQAIERP
jgi:glycosyltransferase involved in cell wall biosynthesis